MHGCARGPPPEGRWGGRSNPPLPVVYFFDHDFDVAQVVYCNCQSSTLAVRVLDGSQQKADVVKTDYSDSLLVITKM